MEENEREEGGMTVGNFFHIVFSQKWIALAILVVITVAGTLGIYFGKNKIERSYDVSFTLELPQTDIKEENASSSATVVYYPDGTPFYYTDIVSFSTLQNVKKSNEAFENINIEKMSRDDDISISRTIYETANNSGAYEIIYNLKVKAGYFPNKDIARDFMVALTNTPADYLGLMDINYNVYINSAKNAPDYVTEISQLIAQASYIVDRYETFVDIYNDISIDGKTLRSYAQDVKSYLNDSGELEILLAESRKNGYLKSGDLKYKYDIELYKLNRQLEIAETTLNNLLKVQGDSESVSSAAIIKAQSDLVAELKQEKREIEEIYQYSNDFGDNKSEKHIAFLYDLSNEYSKVQAFTEEFEKVIFKLYSKVSVVSYSNSNGIATSGETGLVMSFIISFVAGLVVAVIVAFIIGWNKRKKALTAEAAEASAQESVQDNQ